MRIFARAPHAATASRRRLEVGVRRDFEVGLDLPGTAAASLRDLLGRDGPELERCDPSSRDRFEHLFNCSRRMACSGRR